MGKYKFSFVILHYLGFDDTKECIESILSNVEYDYYNIIVVDNGSNNGTGENIKSRYLGNEKVHTIISEDNLGFAKGNNLGYKFAKYNLNSDFICLINNDTIINQKSFIKNIIKIYDDRYFDVLGPDIVSLIDKQHQNPQRIDNGIDKAWVRRWILRSYTLLTLNILGVEDIIRKLKKKRNNSFIQNNNINYKKEYKNIQLHGSCLIFSPNYVKKYEGLYNETFMYMEEDILFYICKRDGLKTLYSPHIKIYHKEDSSTDLLLKKGNLKRRFIYKNTIKSAKILKNLMN
ncbi:glycosyl transferase family protein [[Clostridium] sordellii]|uniref:glycosyltransferase family 2 protein n=1 Tax=Paraclostridium sordellii TaxID=1505 RepID=UPI0005DEAFD7|nr:glycosyltransferase [Paeniclostridium sordellii]CEP94202.1 glycosyl transferase family protein [[Clostridium] sordellii] [Paeniclostridium sordellii]